MSGFRAQALRQADWCERLGSPLTAMVATLLAERLDPQSPLGRRLDGWPGDAVADALTLRLWPDGTDRLLAHAHPHGSRVIWVA